MGRVSSPKLAAEGKINLHSSRRPRRVVARNSKIALFRKNQLSSRGLILTLFYHETTANDYFSQMRLKTSILKNVRRAPLQKRPIKREF